MHTEFFRTTKNYVRTVCVKKPHHIVREMYPLKNNAPTAARLICTDQCRGLGTWGGECYERGIAFGQYMFWLTSFQHDYIAKSSSTVGIPKTMF